MTIDNTNNTAIVAVTRNGANLGQKLLKLLPESALYLPEQFTTETLPDETGFSEPVVSVIRGLFHHYRHLILIMATGIAVRAIAPELENKKIDPGVVVLDEAGKSCISLISGHLGGANELTNRVAGLIGATPVITTASDVAGTISADLLGHQFGWEIENLSLLTGVSAAIVNNEPVGIFQDTGKSEWDAAEETLPDNFTVYPSLEKLIAAKPVAALLISDRVFTKNVSGSLPEYTIVYRPKSLVIGLGCNRNTDSVTIEEAIDTILSERGLSGKSIKLLTTIDVKYDEDGLLKYARKIGCNIEYHTRNSLRRTKFPSRPSVAAEKHVGTPSVCEGAALLSSGADALLVPKVAYNRAVTVAVARFNEAVKKHGQLALVGTGPGNLKYLTLEARTAIERCDTVAGYKTYLSQIESLLKNKEIISTGMGGEVARVRDAIDHAMSGKNVCLISGGDTGIYGMAALAYEMANELPGCDIEIEVIPGITAVVAAASRLGSPVSVDFAVISLSDHLIPIEAIYKRIELAAEGDFVIALYNPKSKKRDSYLAETVNLTLKHRNGSTPVGLVTNACRDNETVRITDLEHLLECEVNMNTIVVIGNSTTFVANDHMITPRGYRKKYELTK